MNELWNEVKFNDRDPHWYTRRVKEAIHIRLHPNNINRDNGIDIPEAWILTVKQHNRRSVQQRTAGENDFSDRESGTADHTGNTFPEQWEDRNAPLLTITIQMVKGNQSTSSRDED